MPISGGLVDGHVVCEGCFCVSAICLSGPGDVFAAGRGLGPGDVEHCGVKAILIEPDSDV